MDKFDFISDDKLKAMLIRDYEELQVCLKHHALKSVLILSGGIIEAVLLEYFTHNLPNNITLEDIVGREEVKDVSGNIVTKFKSGWSLEKFINQAKNENLISEKVQQLSHLVRNYRNLIHPAKELRTLEDFDAETAQMSFSLVNMVLKDVRVNYSRKYPLTAEKVFEKIKLDSNSISIIESLIEKLNQNEKSKLLSLYTEFLLEVLFFDYEQLIRGQLYPVNVKFPFEPHDADSYIKYQKNCLNYFYLIKKNVADTSSYLKRLFDELEIGDSRKLIILFLLFADLIDQLQEENKKALILDYVYNYVYSKLEDIIYGKGGYFKEVNLWFFKVLSIFIDTNELIDRLICDIVSSILLIWSIDKNIGKNKKIQSLYEIYVILDDSLYTYNDNSDDEVYSRIHKLNINRTISFWEKKLSVKYYVPDLESKIIDFKKSINNYQEAYKLECDFEREGHSNSQNFDNQ